MKIQKNRVAVLSMDVYGDGTLIQRMPEDRPLDYIHGTRTLLEGLEHQLEGLEEGASYDITLSPEKAYGKYDSTKRHRIPRENFLLGGVWRDDIVKVGAQIPMLDAYGNVVNGTILEITSTDVLIDFNHILAGKTARFTGKVLSVREATGKELSEGLHGEFLPPEEGCHGSGCHHRGGGGGCCHHHGEGEEGSGKGCCHGNGEEEEEGCCCGEGGGKGEGGGCCCHQDK